ncbi:MAG: IS1595 family transposase [Candidatus Zixiibacteriota bacterium]
MNIIDVFNSFQTQEQAVEYLETKRWRGRPTCPYCGSDKVCRHVSNDRQSQRWQCQDCTKAFAVTVGTIFHGTHIPLRSWFLVVALMLNAKKSASACQIARDIGIRRATVWSMMHRIRSAMSYDVKQKRLLFGIVEADETYVGGKPRKGNRKKDDFGRPISPKNSRRGAGTDKTPVMGAVERNGMVIAEPITGKVDKSKLMGFINKYVERAASLLVTDEHKAYQAAYEGGAHASINHQERYVDGWIHTNTIEGFWSLVKRAWYGQHHQYSKKYMFLYIAEACYKYNVRKKDDSFHDMIGAMVNA